MKSILIIDDEKQICESVKMILDYEDYHSEYSTDVEEGLEKLKYNYFDALLLDIQMPGMTGFEVLKWMEEQDIKIPVIVISAHSTLENAVKATKLGAFDFLEKPIDRDKLLISIRNAVGHSKLKKENETLKENLGIEQEIIGESKKIRQIIETVDRIAQTDARVLITGENGTG
ncbi:MAG: sigma-54-dependent Fis family transcriptional regulator, partial [Ignavibacteria bacterium]